MQVLTTESVREHLTPGDSVRDAWNVVHTVFKVLHTGYGFAGVLLTTRSSGNGHVYYAVWVVNAEGKVVSTMSTNDFPAVNAAFLARVIESVRETRTGEVTA